MTTPQTGYSDLPTTKDELSFAPSVKALAVIVQDAPRRCLPPGQDPAQQRR